MRFVELDPLVFGSEIGIASARLCYGSKSGSLFVYGRYSMKPAGDRDNEMVISTMTV